MTKHNNSKKNEAGLAAILLLTRSKPGSRLVFNYPPEPQSDIASQLGAHDARDEDADAQSDSDTSDDLPSRKDADTAAIPSVTKALQGSIDGSEEKKSNPLESVLGYSRSTLEKLLSPERWCDRKKFQICVNGLTFVGHPIFADHDGKWAKRGATTSPVKTGDERSPSTDEAQTDAELSVRSSGAVNITAAAVRGSESNTNRFDHVPDSFESPLGHSLATSMQSTSTTSTNVAERLSMFHVVFVLRSSDPATASEVYRHVARKLSKALSYCQKQDGYVDAESRKLHAIRLKARPETLDVALLWAEMLEHSELAWALKEIYEGISSDRVAAFRLSGSEMALQLPQKEQETMELNVHSSLLLLEDRDVLERSLSHPDATTLLNFVRSCLPTKSLEKNARNLGMPVGHVLYMARHMVKWRKGRAIDPLHPRNYYIVNPDLVLDDLSDHVTQYALRFSALPSLPQMLKTLSGKPIKYGSLIPSRDHREAYMEILEYLVRYRLVVQLKTYGWLQLSTPDLLEVRPAINENRRPLSVAKLLSPQLRAVDDDSVSVSSERTAIPLTFNDTGRRFSSNDPPRPGSAMGDSQTEPTSKTLILDPGHISAEAEHALNQLRHSLADEELRSRLETLLPHFDGEHALEGIAALQGLKRSKVEHWLETLQEAGHLLIFRRV